MQKKIIALALAGLASSAAFAQSNVTIYGRADIGYTSRGGNDGLVQGTKTKNEFRDGANGGSRIGFKGAEDLGNGLKAIFQAEFGIAMDAPSYKSDGTASVNQASAAFWTNRNSYVGLTGGFGTAVAGRLDGVRYGIFNKYDAFAGGGAGNFTQMTTQYDRADNAIAYISPKFNGFTLTLAHSTNTGGVEGNSGNTDTGAPAGTAGKAVGNKSDDRLYTIALNYTNGPFSADLDYETTTQVNIDDSRLKTWVAAASYDFGVVKVGALFDHLESSAKGNIGAIGGAAGTAVAGGYDRDAYFVSASAPVAANTILKATWGKVKNKLVDNADGTKFGLGVQYNLSKRTNVYANYGKISNDNAAAFSISSSANAGPTGGYGVRAIDFGLAHTF